MRGIGTTSRALLVGIVLVIVTVVERDRRPRGCDPLRHRVHCRARRRPRDVLRRGGEGVKRALAVVALLALTLPSRRVRAGGAGGGGEVRSRRTSGSSTTWGPELKIGPIDMSINKAVAYLLLGTIVLDRHRDRLHARPARPRSEPPPGARRDDLRGRAGAGRRAGPADEGDRALVPVRRHADGLHLGRSTCSGSSRCRSPTSAGRSAASSIPTFAIFAATSTLSVTLALALMTFVFTHVEGIRENGAIGSTSRAGSRTCRRRCCR